MRKIEGGIAFDRYLPAMRFTPRIAGMVALLALFPVVLFGLGRTWWAGAVTVVNVLIISLSLYLLMSPTENGHGEDHDAHDGTGGGAA